MSIIADLPMPGERLYKSDEVAAMFRVDPKTVARWARIGRLRTVPTPGGRLHRFPESAVKEFFENDAEFAEAVTGGRVVSDEASRTQGGDAEDVAA